MTTITTQQTLTHKYDQAAGAWHSSIQRMRFTDAYTGLVTRLDALGYFHFADADTNVFEAGIGTGALSIAFAQQMPEVRRFTGIDISEAMLTQTAQNFAALDVVPQLSCQSVTDLHFADNAFDLALNAHVLEHLPDPAAGLNELARTLKPGAPLVTLTSRWCPFTALQQGWWNYRIIRYRHLTAMMREAGLVNIHTVMLSRMPWVRDMSRAVIAFKA